MMYITIALYIASTLACTLGAFDSTDLHNFFWANYLHYNGNYDAAQTWYGPLLSKKNSYIYKGYIPFLFETNHYKDIIALIPSLEKQFEQDVEIQLLFAQALMKIGNQQTAQERFIKLNSQFKTDQAIAFQTATIYMNKQEPENALMVIDTLLNNSPKKPNNFIFHFLKAQICLQMNDTKRAHENLKKCLSLAPSFDKAWLLIALLEEQAGQLTEAIKGYTNFLEMSETPNHSVEQHLIQLVFKQKMLAQQSPLTPANSSLFSQALYHFEKKDYTLALQSIEQHLEKNNADPEARLLKIQILTALNQHAQAANILKQWILEEPNKQEWLQTLYLLYKNGLPVQKAIAVLEDITQAQPNNITPVLYLADLNTRIEHRDTALMHYKKALSLTTQPKLTTKLLYQMALIYHDQRNFKAMEQVLEQGLVLGLNFPPLMNLLAYHYAKSDMDLNKAQALVEQALVTQHDNPHFLDTKALILYKQQQFDTVIDILHSVIEQLPDDFSALLTLGKSYYKTGHLQQALATIEKAQQATVHNDEKEQCTQLLTLWNSKQS